VLRFTTAQILNRLNDDCIPKIAAQINALGGIVVDSAVPRRIELLPDGMRQKGLFDN
jgi:hypothetical protein